MKIKVSEATPIQLDWMVANIENLFGVSTTAGYCRLYVWEFEDSNGLRDSYAPTTNWAQGGPIIEREGICVSPSAAGLTSWVADMPLKPRSFADKTRCSGTPLIAAMRCYVTSKLGDEVEVPEELCQN